MAAAISRRALSELIGSIYDCTLDPSRWQKTLIEIATAFDSEIAALGLADIQQDRVPIELFVGMDQYWLKRLGVYRPELHRMLDAFAGHLSPDEPRILSRHVPTDYRKTSPYFQEYLRPQKIVDFMQYHLMETATHFSALAVGRHERQGVYTNREIGLGGLLLPHLRRAVTISKVLDVQTINQARMAEALDALRCGVVLVNEDGAILHANRSAEQMLRNGDLITAVHGFLDTKARSAAKELRTAVMLAARDEAGIQKAGLAIRLTDRDSSPTFAHVLPMAGGDLRASFEPQSAAAVFIGAYPEDQTCAEIVAAAYALTPAEGRVLAGLVAGHTLAETADALGIATTTARTHLDSIFLKTGVSRQAELMRLAMQVAAAGSIAATPTASA